MTFQALLSIACRSKCLTVSFNIFLAVWSSTARALWIKTRFQVRTFAKFILSRGPIVCYLPLKYEHGGLDDPGTNTQGKVMKNPGEYEEISNCYSRFFKFQLQSLPQIYLDNKTPFTRYRWHLKTAWICAVLAYCPYNADRILFDSQNGKVCNSAVFKFSQHRVNAFCR